MGKPFLHAVVGIALIVCGCGQKHIVADARPVVFVSIVPQKYFVDKISNGLVQCLVMVPPGTNAHSYEPRPAQMALLSKSKAYFSIGLEFEGPWLPKFASIAKTIKIVRTDSLVPKIAMQQNCGHTSDSLKNSGGHEHTGLDPHIWLSPALVKIQASTIAAALGEIVPLHRDTFLKNCDIFLREIDSLQQKISSILPCDSATLLHPKVFLVFHPTWGYFAKDFCLKQVAIEAEGKEPNPRLMKSILDTARSYRIHTVFVQPEFSRKSAEVIAHELGAKVLDADALAYDWPNTLLSVAKRIAGQ
jgi:zinc transport system substrate-binding protein